MGGVSEQTVERVHGALIDRYGDQPFRCDQKSLAAQLGLSAPTVCMALAALRSEGRLTRSGRGRRETWRVYGEASTRRAARMQPRPGVEEQLEEIRAALAVLTARLAASGPGNAPAAAAAALRSETASSAMQASAVQDQAAAAAQPSGSSQAGSAPDAAAAGPAPSPPPNPLLIKIFFNAADEAELARFRELRARGGGTSLAEQTRQLYLALLSTEFSLPALTEYVRQQTGSAPAAPAPATAAPAVQGQTAAAAQPAGSSQAGPAPAAAAAGPEPAAAAEAVQAASAASAAAVARAQSQAPGTVAQAVPEGAAQAAAAMPEGEPGQPAASRPAAAAGAQPAAPPAGTSQAAAAQAGGAPAAAAPDLSGIPRPRGQLRPLPSGASGVPAIWPQEWPAGTYGCDEQGVIFYLRGGAPLPLPRLVRPDPQLPARMLTEDGRSLTAQQLLTILQEYARTSSPQWQDYLSCMQPRHG